MSSILLPPQDLNKFMLESNAIEGEDRLNPQDVLEARLACQIGFRDTIDILNSHKHLTEHLNVGWGGKWRSINVEVGGYAPPDWHNIPELMAQFMDNFGAMDSWEAHNQFEKIHPFQDFNGRMGRLIWLSKAVQEGYDFKIPFLQAYYYQTLKKLIK